MSPDTVGTGTGYGHDSDTCRPEGGSVTVTSAPVPPPEKVTGELVSGADHEPSAFRRSAVLIACHSPFTRTRTGVASDTSSNSPSGCASTSLVSVISEGTATGFPVARACAAAEASAAGTPDSPASEPVDDGDEPFPATAADAPARLPEYADRCGTGTG